MLKIRRVINERSLLDPVCVSCTRPEHDDLAFAATEHWKVLLHPDQTVPGALVLASLRHVPKISELTEAESADWFALYSAVEVALEQLHGAELVNAYCQRNWAYRTPDPDPPFLNGHPNPHVHWHIAPRYRVPVTVAGETFHDVDFGHPLVWKARRISAERRSIVMTQLLELLVGQPGVQLSDPNSDESR